MTIKVKIDIDLAPLEGIEQYLKTREPAVKKIVEDVYRRLAPNIVALLQRIPGLPSYPIVWKTEKQRRFVMAMLTRKAKAEGRYPDISYRRTGEGAAGWVWSVVPTDDGIRLDIRNRWAASQFVYGTLNQRSVNEAVVPQQPFHRGRWPLAAKIVKDGFAEIDDEIKKLLSDEDKKSFKLIIRRRSRKPRG